MSESKVDLFDELRRVASQIYDHDQIGLAIRERQKRVIVRAMEAQMTVRRIAEASRISVGRVYQIRDEVKGGK